MTPRALAAAVLAAVIGLVPQSASAAEFENFASPVYYSEDGGLIANVVCHLSNSGSTAIRIKDLRIFTGAGGDVELDANSCGPKSGFDLAPGDACRLATTRDAVGNAGCRALVKNGAALRGRIELRDGLETVRGSGELTLSHEGANPADYVFISSPFIFDSNAQRLGTCVFTNVGTEKAYIRSAALETFGQGTLLKKDVDDCERKDGVTTAPPGKSCTFNHKIFARPFSCHAETTGRADMRGAFIIRRDDGRIYNVIQMK